LLSKVGLTNSERKRVVNLLEEIKVLKIDDAIIKKFHLLVSKYGERPGALADYVIAATAWAKKLPLLTRNRKHFELIKEIKLSPVY
jgi:predicted nucleic acid-binding protein